MSTLFKVSIVIPTYNRPDDLKDCIQSILQQTVKPDEIIIVDDGELRNLPLKDECERSGIIYRYQKKNGHRGPAASRNTGAKIANGDIVFFLDDDVILFPEYVEEILKVYKSDAKDGRIGGVGGIIINEDHTLFLHKLYHSFFLISSFRGGKILPSGFSSVETGIAGFPSGKITRVDFLPGGVCSFRKEIFSEFLYSEDYSDYSRGEDKDFSYRVSRKYELLVNPKARLLHKKSDKENYDTYKKGWDFVMSRYLLFKNNLKKTPFHLMYFYYALFGYMLERAAVMVFTGAKHEKKRMKGILDACIYTLKNP